MRIKLATGAVALGTTAILGAAVLAAPGSYASDMATSDTSSTASTNSTQAAWYYGSIHWYNYIKGFGFVTAYSGTDYFWYPVPLDALRWAGDGTRVLFQVVYEGNAFRAINVHTY